MGCGFGPWFYQTKNFIVEVSIFVVVGMCLLCDSDVYLTMLMNVICSLYVKVKLVIKPYVYERPDLVYEYVCLEPLT